MGFYRYFSISRPFQVIVFLGLLVFSISYTQSISAQTLGVPPNITDVYDANDQVGYCLDAAGGNSCTANDFRITNIDVTNIDDGCSSPDDYMQLDLDVTFTKGQPARYDIGVWFYRGDDTSDNMTSFNTEDANTGQFCTRETLNVGLTFVPGGLMTSLIDADICADVPGGDQNDEATQAINDVVLPCRDVGTVLTPTPDGIPDGVADISACTSWRNSADNNCTGSAFSDDPPNPLTDTGANPGTGSKCNCVEFNGVPGIGIPDISVTKSCTPAIILPPDTSTTCTITMTNSGTGTMLGSTAPGIEGFFYQDDYDESQGGVSSITISSSPTGQAFDTDYLDPVTNVADVGNGAIGIYPGDIAPSSSVIVTYVYTPDEGLGVVDIPNTVCTYYSDEGEDGSTDIVEYFNVDVDALCDNFTVTTPVTLSQFEITTLADGYSFDWTTATETNNIGFNIYGLRGETLFKLNDEMILSQAVNSVEPLTYNFLHLVGVDSTITKFFLEDIDGKGKATKHGPFLADITYGDSPNIGQARTDWAKVKGQNLHSLSKKQNKKKTNIPDFLSTIHIPIEETGLQRVSFDQLVTLGVDIKLIELGRFTLTDANGMPVATRIVKSKKSDTGFIEFIGKELTTFYDDTNVYQLIVTSRNNDAKEVQIATSQKGKVVGEPAQYYMHTESLDDNVIYAFSSGVPEEPWYLDQLIAFGVNANSLVYDLPVSEVYSEQSIPSSISAKFINGYDFPGADESDGFVQLFANSDVVEEFEFNGMGAKTLQGDISLASNQQSVSVELALTPLNAFNYALLYTDELHLTYPRKHVAIDNQLIFSGEHERYRVIGFTVQSVHVYAESSIGETHYLGQKFVNQSGEVTFDGVSGLTEYFVVGETQINSPSVGVVNSPNIKVLQADHLVIAHPLFIGDRLQQYLDQRHTGSDETTAVVSTEHIYQHYSGGMRDAVAIKSFIKDIAGNGQLQSVMLVGGDVYDYNDYLGFGAQSYVPTLYRETSDIITFTPTDVLFGDINGDQVPDIPIGRLPVRTVQELDRLLSKMEVFNDNGDNKTAVLSADEQGLTSAYNFIRSSELIADVLEPAGWDITRAYIDELGIANAKSVLIDSLNNGVRLSAYTGHSSDKVWSWKNLFSYNDALGLQNYNEPSAYLQWGCYTTYFVSPKFDTMSHALMLGGSQGAAVVIGASTLTDAQAEAGYAAYLQQELTDSSNTFGEALVKSKQRFADENGLAYRDIIWGISLLGDPLLKLSAQ